MDLTETFRNEDISKTDFFDFVVGPDTNDSQQFTKQMRAVNAYLGNGETEQKEMNNNAMALEVIPPQNPTTEASTTTTTTTSGFDNTFWSCDKDTVRIETAILEDLNKYCWSQQEDAGTDGHIYTLTVLNGPDQNASWYRPPLSSLGIVKEEDGNSMTSPASLEQIQQNALDIDSILNIIPAGQPINGYTSSGNNTVYLASSGDPTLNSPNTDGLIKSETYTYEDSNYVDTKDELTNSMIIDTPMLEAHDGYNNNNNDWKLNNNNSVNTGTGTEAAADSLLRSALQGKAFVRYNGNTTKIKQEPHSELKRALSTPPNTEKIEEEQQTLVQGIDTSTILFVDGTRLADSDSAPSTHSVDDILLSQLEAESYPEDYEKLKRIANEVAELQQYCQIDPIYTLTSNDQQVIQTGIPTVQVSVTSTKPISPKKYKRSNSGNGSRNSNVQGTTSSSNGVRKERSLHYCSICSKGFKDKYSVNVHIRTHTGEKPFSCSLCGKSFRQKAHLAKHYQTHIAQKNAAAANTPKAGSKSTR